MRYLILFVAALFTLGLTACDRPTTVVTTPPTDTVVVTPVPGPPGPQGETGAQAEKGATGDTGMTGAEGAKGEQGNTGGDTIVVVPSAR